MAVTELRADTLSADRAEVTYLITGEATAIDAKAALITAAASTYNSLPIQTRQVSVAEEDADETYLGRVPYGASGGQVTNADLVVGDTRILINASGGTTHISNSLGTEHSYGTAEDYKTAIGVDSDGGVAGVDILSGSLDITIVKILASTDVDTAYLAALMALITPNPHTNDAIFSHTDTDGRTISLAAGEALFTGFTTAPRGEGEDELRINLKGSKNLTGLEVGDMTGIAKDGWEHLWAHFEPRLDAVNNLVVNVPVSAYVEKVYEEGDFSDLAL